MHKRVATGRALGNLGHFSHLIFKLYQHVIFRDACKNKYDKVDLEPRSKIN